METKLILQILVQTSDTRFHWNQFIIFGYEVCWQTDIRTHV